jgi:PGF-pre-PGF domain-containing protein
MVGMRKKEKSFTVSALITLFIVAMLVISGPAQAVQVSIDTNNINGRAVGETAFFYVNITIGANERIPIANISVEGLPDIPGSPGGVLIFNVSDFNSVGAYVIKNNYNISLADRHGWVGGYGYGYGYDNNNKIAPYNGYGNMSQFYGYGYGYDYGYDYGYGYGYSHGYGYGYGYGYGNPDTYTSLNYKITVDTTGAKPQVYDIVAKVNTDRGVLFHESESFELTDNIPPASVTDLHNMTYAQTYINWTWTDPADADFSKVIVSIDGGSPVDVLEGTEFYNATGFAPDTEHTISTRTMDASGNINSTWVNRTDRTAPTPPASTIQVTIEISPQTINLNSNGVITVSLLNNTPAGFDVADINVSTVRFADNAIALSSNIAANKLILKFNTKDTNIQCGDTQAILTGKIYTGEVIVGSASIVTGGCGGGGSSSGSSSISGGGGGGGTSDENYSNIEIKEKHDGHIYKDIAISYAFTNKNNPILFINITGNVNAGEITTVIEVLRKKSSLVKSPAPGIVYKNLNIWVGTSGFAVTKNIKKAVVRFRVENSMISNNNLASSDIKLVKWDGSQWIQLETTEVAKDSIYTYYDAKANSFSPYAITGFKGEDTPVATQPGIAPKVIGTDTPATTLELSKEAPSNSLAIIGAIVLIAIVAVVYIKRKEIFK